MSDAEIEFLVEQGAPLDKAGAYAVQAQAALFIERIEGDYWNVVGLPASLVYELIKDLGHFHNGFIKFNPPSAFDFSADENTLVYTR
jgi:predicted house-cleaning NTP pyrophosphatase (Maf/HAM1 superfamily)